ncbi:hypothetical protein ACMBCN_02915 [Candidatus Liberibacter asiaticus]
MGDCIHHYLCHFFSLIQQMLQFTFVDYLFNNCNSSRDLVDAARGFIFLLLL